MRIVQFSFNISLFVRYILMLMSMRHLCIVQTFTVEIFYSRNNLRNKFPPQTIQSWNQGKLRQVLAIEENFELLRTDILISETDDKRLEYIRRVNYSTSDHKIQQHVRRLDEDRLTNVPCPNVLTYIRTLHIYILYVSILHIYLHIKESQARDECCRTG